MSLFNELKRRNVFKVAAAYIIVAWLLLQVGEVLQPALLLPEWVNSVLAFFLILGLPLAIFFAWAFEMTPDGIKPEREVDRSQSITPLTGRRLDFLIIAALCVAVVFLGANLWLEDDVTPAGALPAVSPGKSVAVLPFDNRSADKEDAEFFAAGVHDELLTLLSRLGDLKVISRTSMERIDRTLTVPEIGELLGVATVVEGQVQRSGNRLRINVQLIDAAREDHLWANIYDRELTAENIFDVQSDIARKIAAALQAQLSPNDEAVLAAVPTQSTEALENYLLGRQLTNRSTYASLRRAQSYLDEAVRLDPEFAQALVASADNYAQSLLTGAINQREYIESAEPLVQRALDLDAGLPEAWAQQGALLWKKGDIPAAEAAYQKALSLSPDDSASLLAYGRFMRVNSRPLEAIPLLERLLEDDPLSENALFELGKAEMYAGRPERFIKRSKRIMEIDPANALGHTGMIQAYIWMGRYGEMFPWYLGALEADPGDYENFAHLALHFDSIGMSEIAEPYLERALEMGPGEPAVLKCKALSLWMRGRGEEALEVARQSLEQGLDDRWGSRNVFLRLVRDEALRTGQHEQALAWFRDQHSELFAIEPVIDIDNVNAAADLALLLRSAGQSDAADDLIRASQTWYRENQVPGVYGYVTGIVDVQLLALDGQRKTAMERLIGAVESGWSVGWRFELDNPNLDNIRDDLTFQIIVKRLNHDMAAQAEIIRAYPDLGPLDFRNQ